MSAGVHNGSATRKQTDAVQECLTGRFLHAVSHKSFDYLHEEQHAAPRN